MISVTFTADVENIVATEHLYQWDNGQKLSISGVGTSADIHFANKKSEKALVVTPTVTSGAMEAPIPNSLLAEPYPIIAYVYVPSDDGSKTIKSVTINVEARKQPSDFVLTEDEGVTTLESISQRANAIMSNIQTDYNTFKGTIQSELDDMVANTTIPNADTLDGYHASDFVLTSDVSTNADTVDGKHANEFFQKSDLSHSFALGTDPSVNESRFIPFCDSAGSVSKSLGWLAHTQYADGRSAVGFLVKNNVSSGQTSFGIIVTISKDGKTYYANTIKPSSSGISALRNISCGTGEATTTNCPAGALYGQYE